MSPNWARRGIPAVCGVAELSFARDAMTIGTSTFSEGEVISIDGGTGEIFPGEIETSVEEDEYLAIFARLGDGERFRRGPLEPLSVRSLFSQRSAAI
jgi:phosphoenolpyruvate synthase/pyruvate phosphate dikinase